MSEISSGNACPIARILYNLPPETDSERRVAAAGLVLGCIGCTATGELLDNAAVCPSESDAMVVMRAPRAGSPGGQLEIQAGVRAGGLVEKSFAQMAARREQNNIDEAPGGRERMRRALIDHWNADSLPPRQEVWGGVTTLLQSAPGKFETDDTGTILGRWGYEGLTRHDGQNFVYTVNLHGQVDTELVTANLEHALAYITPDAKGRYTYKLPKEVRKAGLLDVPFYGPAWRESEKQRQLQREMVARHLNWTVPPILRTVEATVRGSIVGERPQQIVQCRVERPVPADPDADHLLEVPRLKTGFFESCVSGFEIDEAIHHGNKTPKITTKTLLAYLRKEDPQWGLGCHYAPMQEVLGLLKLAAPVEV